jgi:hypothetical protein
MTEFLKILLIDSGISGIILAFIFVGAGIFGIISLWKTIKRKVSAVKKIGSIEFSETKDNMVLKMPINSLSQQNIDKIFIIISDVISQSIEDHQKIVKNESIEIVNEIEKCINNMILTISNDFVTNRSEKEIVQNETLLELFLESKFRKIINNHLTSISNSSNLIDMDDSTFKDEVGRIVESISQETLRDLRKILPLNQKTLIGLFENQNRKLTDNITSSIKTFIKASKIEKQQIIELSDKRSKSLQEKLQIFLIE